MTDKVVADLVGTINNNPFLEELHVAGNSLSNGLIDVIKACKMSVNKLIALDTRCNLVDPSKVSDMASTISGIDTLEVLCVGGLVVDDNEKFFMKFVLRLQQLNTHTFVMNINKECEILELLTSESDRETIQNYIKMNYDFEYMYYNQADPMIGLFNGHLISKYDYLNIRLQRAQQNLLQVDATSMIYFLPVISKLRVLDLELSNVNEVAAIELGGILSCNNVLEQLWLAGNQLGIVGAIFILNSLKYMSSLTVLDLSFNNIGFQSADSVAAVINCNPKLEQLWLDGNGLLDVGVKQICIVLQSVSNLRILSLCSNGITDDAAEELSNTISANNHLENVSLGNNKLQSVGICKILYALNYLCKLRKLDLFHNGVTKECAEKLAVFLSNCYSFQELYLSDNMLETEAAIKIFESLKHKSKLQVLTLSNNNITDEAINELCLVLAQNPRLQVLLLGENKLQTDGVVRIAQVVKRDSTIMHILALCENNVSEQGKEKVIMMFSDNTLIHVYL
ncbi:leucine-rich repeat-containing protein 74B-like [Dysidea avara]|uniref:leucine-rich repeat-containing protein 74B-like n=1 Tax=Dysidea avara TaxID=196820 RepID=UPI00331BC380